MWRKFWILLSKCIGIFFLIFKACYCIHTLTLSEWPCVLFVYFWLFEAEWVPPCSSDWTRTHCVDLTGPGLPKLFASTLRLPSLGFSHVPHLTLWTHCMLLVFPFPPPEYTPNSFLMLRASTSTFPSVCKPGHWARGKGLQNNINLWFYWSLPSDSKYVLSKLIFFFASSMENQLFYI